MSHLIKGAILILLLVAGSIFIWNSNENKEESLPLTPEALMKTMRAVKIETYPLSKNISKPMFQRVDGLERLAFFKNQARVKEKVLMVYFYTNGCYYCEKMKNITFADSTIQDELKKDFIAVSVNYSQYKHSFREKFHLRATPAIIFFNKEGEKIEEEPSYGYQGIEDFHNKLLLLSEPF